MSDTGLAVGVDVGGSKTAALRIDATGTVLARHVLPTPADDTQGILDTMVAAVREVVTPDVRTVGVGAAGLVEAGVGRLTFAPNLAWRNVPLAEWVWDTLGLPALADNDNNAAAWGEYRLGAGRGSGHMLFVGVGTGIGGGIVVDGALLRGAHGFAAEVGHVVVEPDGPLCGCGNRGCWEQVASGHALTRAGREERLERLRQCAGPAVDTLRPPRGAAWDDLLDAAALAWVAVRIARGEARCVPENPPRDPITGQEMAIWF